jgi:hypothetical protein
MKKIVLLTFDENILKEKFQYLGTFSGFKVFDSKHAVEEFNKHFPKYTLSTYEKILSKGMKKIYRKYNTDTNNYMIISYSTGIRIPIHVRPDEQSPKEIIGVTPTTLGEKEVLNLRNEIEIFVESNKNSYCNFPLIENFNYFVKSGEIFSDFEIVELD